MNDTFCEFCKLKRANGIIRTKDVCRDCCSIIRKDNLNRQKLNIEIRDDLKILDVTFNLFKEHPLADIFKEYIE
ncbi:MAG: hypothetical protein PHS54_07550 [Clostridia bacterium]|nr:hypothetical protein [Clostridia bacterium]